jgi:hypothetical protein
MGLDGVRGAAAVVLVLTAATACGDGDSSGARPGVAASCAAPEIQLSRPTAAPGEEIRVAGRWFVADCYDTGQPGSPPPSTDLPVTFTGAGGAEALSRVDAGADGSVRLTVTVPDDAAAGPARITVGSASAALTVEG